MFQSSILHKISNKKIAGSLLLPVLLFISLLTAAQKPASNTAHKGPVKKLNIIADKFIHQTTSPTDSNGITILVGHVILTQGNTVFKCDSAIYNEQIAAAEAFGHVDIREKKGVHIKSDYLRYTGIDQKAYLKDNVRLVHENMVLTTPELEYDMNSKTATYNNGGHIINGSTVLDSKTGIHYGQTNDATFMGDVKLDDPKYRIRTETLQYNTKTKKAVFTVPTVIDDRKNRKINTSDGYYDLIHKTAYFGKRPTIIDSTSTLIANEVATEDATGFGEARGNVIFKDTAQGIRLLANNLKTNRTDGSFLATEMPLLIIKQENNDSLYLAADTFYSGRLSDRMKTSDSIKLRLNAFYLSQRTNEADTGMHRVMPQIEVKNITTNTVSSTKTHIRSASDSISGETILKKDSTISIKKQPVVIAHPDSLNIEPADSAGIITQIADSIPPTNLNDKASKDSIQTTLSDSISAPKTIVLPEKKNPVSKKHHNRFAKSKNKHTGANRRASDTSDPNKDRYFEGYPHVRIYSDSVQAAGDSLFYSMQDSLFRLFKNPIVWTKENQLTGDTIYLYTENKKPKRIYVMDNAIVINKVDTVTAHQYYNQVKGKTINALFTNGDIDSLRAQGNAESVYFLLDNGNKYIGVDKNTTDVIDMYFQQRQPERVVMRGPGNGGLSPLLQISENEMRLKGFSVQNDRRPKSKYDLLKASAVIIEAPEETKEEKALPQTSKKVSPKATPQKAKTEKKKKK